jgi:hypothetical protein
VGLPIACAPAGHGVRSWPLRGVSVYLGKWFRLMAPQDHRPAHSSSPTVELSIDIIRRPAREKPPTTGPVLHGMLQVTVFDRACLGPPIREIVQHPCQRDVNGTHVSQ